MSILYNGQIKSMPPKLLTDDQSLIVIRPLAYCQEKDIIKYVKAQVPSNILHALSSVQPSHLMDVLELEIF